MKEDTLQTDRQFCIRMHYKQTSNNRSQKPTCARASCAHTRKATTKESFMVDWGRQVGQGEKLKGREEQLIIPQCKIQLRFPNFTRFTRFWRRWTAKPIGYSRLSYACQRISVRYGRCVFAFQVFSVSNELHFDIFWLIMFIILENYKYKTDSRVKTYFLHEGTSYCKAYRDFEKIIRSDHGNSVM